MQVKELLNQKEKLVEASMAKEAKVITLRHELEKVKGALE